MAEYELEYLNSEKHHAKRLDALSLDNVVEHTRTLTERLECLDILLDDNFHQFYLNNFKFTRLGLLGILSIVYAFSNIINIFLNLHYFNIIFIGLLIPILLLLSSFDFDHFNENKIMKKWEKTHKYQVLREEKDNIEYQIRQSANLLFDPSVLDTQLAIFSAIKNKYAKLYGQNFVDYCNEHKKTSFIKLKKKIMQTFHDKNREGFLYQLGKMERMHLRVEKLIASYLQKHDMIEDKILTSQFIKEVI